MTTSWNDRGREPVFRSRNHGRSIHNFLVGILLPACLCVVMPLPRMHSVSAAGDGGAVPCGTAVTAAPAPTSLITIEQAYDCLLAHYPTGQSIDDRILLHGAMVGLVNALIQHRLDTSVAVLPALRGDHASDRQAFSRMYAAITQHLPKAHGIRESLAQATIAGLVSSLQDDHSLYAPPLVEGNSKGAGLPVAAAGAADFGLGLRLSADSSLPARTTAPLFVIGVDGVSPAARAGIRPGDVIMAINGFPPFIQGLPNPASLAQLNRPDIVHLRIERPTTGKQMTLTVTPAAYPTPQPVTARVLRGNIAYVQLHTFVDNAANYVFAAVDGLGLGKNLRGLILDLRGNGGGSPAEPPRLLGAFAPGRVYAVMDDGHGHLTASHTNTTMPVIKVPLAVLIDRGCASACDVTAAAIRDLNLGRLVGERTAGDAAGPAVTWSLNDGGVLEIPVAFYRGANGEFVDGIGVPPDDAAPVTAAALSAGHDSGIDQAVRDIQLETIHPT